MRNKRALADFIVEERKEIGKDREQRDGALVLSKEQLIGILVKFEEEVECLPFSDRSNDAISEQTEECDCNACTLCEHNANNQKESSEVEK